jgi:hypothetical protein
LNFNQQASTFSTGYSVTDTGAAASTTQNAWVNLNNAIFGTQNLIGSVGPFIGAGALAGTSSANVLAGPALYSLTLEQIFTHTGIAGSSIAFSSDGNITGSVPEPGAIVLFGTVLVWGATRLRRRTA